MNLSVFSKPYHLLPLGWCCEYIGQWKCVYMKVTKKHTFALSSSIVPYGHKWENRTQELNLLTGEKEKYKYSTMSVFVLCWCCSAPQLQLEALPSSVQLGWFTWVKDGIEGSPDQHRGDGARGQVGQVNHPRTGIILSSFFCFASGFVEFCFCLFGDLAGLKINTFMHTFGVKLFWESLKDNKT